MKFKKFDGKDFSMWKAKVLNGLRYLGLQNWLTVKAEQGKTPDQVAPELRALAFAMDALSDNLFRQYQDIETIKDLWDRLKTDYETSDMQLQFVLRNKFLTCRKSKNEKMSDYVKRLTAFSHDLKSAGNEVKDADFILTLVNGTHEEFGAFVSAVCGKKGVNDIVKTDIISQLIKEDELRRSMHSSSYASSDRRVYFTKNKFKHNENKKPLSLSDKKKRKCYNCGTPGHFANECKKPRSEVKEVGKEYCVKENESKPRVCQIRNVSWKDDQKSGKWLLDSGASTHACNDASLFETLSPEDSSIVVGDDREIKVTGRGTVKLKMKANRVVNTLVLNDVALVLDLGVN